MCAGRRSFAEGNLIFPLKRSLFVVALVALVILIDQGVKIWVKTHMLYGEEFELLGLEWANFKFIENPGMAFGIEFGGAYGKLALSLFRIVAVGFLIYLIRQLIQQGATKGLLACFALILAGAVGNIIDSAFYGVIFSASPHHEPATMFPPEGGYAPFMYGKVVDMLYFPMFEGVFPEWLPVWGGEPYLFFRPIFNIADASISVGVFCLLIFYRSFFQQEPEPLHPLANADVETPATLSQVEDMR